MNQVKDNSKRAKNAVLLIYIIMGISIISLFSGYLQYNLLNKVLYGGIVSNAEATANDLREQIIGLAYSITYIVSVVMFIMWFRRAYFNLHTKVKTLSYSEGWAAGSWFVPILCLFRPYQIMTEIYEETKKLFKKHAIQTENELHTRYVGIWWTFWIISSFVGQINFRMALRATTLDQLINTTIISMVNDFITISLCVLAVKVIRDYAKVEPLLHQLDEEKIKLRPISDSLEVLD